MTTSAGELGATEVTEVADNVFAYIQHDGSWWINNTGFLVSQKSVTVIDSCSTHRRTKAFAEHIGEVTDNPVSTLVNTHHHGDHTFGNSLFAAATIIGHENCRSAMRSASLPPPTGIWEPVEWGPLELAPPTLTFTESIRLWHDESPVELRYAGQPAHTDNDVLVWLPEQRVLFCGDLLFAGGTPFLLAGSVTGAALVLREVVAALPAEVVVPGHGRPCALSLVDETLAYLRLVLDLARDGLAAGLPPLDVAREADLGGFADWLDAERLVGNLHRAYADLAPQTFTVDHRAALADMVAYNGGRPLTCHA